MKKIAIAFALLTTLLLGIYGLDWGLPSRWCIDEPVAGSLSMMSHMSIVPKDDYDHPTLHYFILTIFMAPYLFFLKLTSYPVHAVVDAASVSWIYLSNVDPKFSRAVYLIARSSSVIFAVLTVYLSYRLAKRCFSEKSGIFTALVLSVTMAFISEAHQAKSTAFLMFMAVATVLACAYYYDKRTPARYIVPFLLGGLTLATKYSGGIVLFPLVYYLFAAPDGKIRFKALAPISFLAGFLLGFPGLIVNFSSYFAARSNYTARYIPASIHGIGSLFISGVGGYLLILKDAFGIGLFTLVLLGAVFSLKRLRHNMPLKLTLSVIIPYFLLFAVSPRSFALKYISLIIPFLAIFASGAAEQIFSFKGFYRKTVFLSFAIIWLVSFKYTLACDDIYAYKDIRYKATEWIKKNIDKTRKVIILGHPEWVVHNDFFKDYDVFIINNKPGGFNPKYNRRFRGGRQYPLTKQDLDSLTKALEKEHDYYLIYPVHGVWDRFSFWKRNEFIYDYGIGLSGQRKIKEFSADEGSFLWNPNIGGYEPRKIVITCGIK